MSTIEDVKSRLDIVELVGERVPLKKAGRNFKGLCPFHQERTPSFIVFPDSQSYHCFGCGAGGDAFTFLMQMENLTFPEALRQLARRVGVALRPPTPEEKEADRERKRLQELNLAAAHFFHHQLRHSEAGAMPRAYLEERQISAETVQAFLLGYAPDQWESLSEYLQERGYGEEELLVAGLVTERESGGTYDRFRHRLIFPIRDRKGHVIGFGGRTLDKERPPKYLNSPQTPLFDKSAVLYGLDQAAAAIRRQGRAILVEGYFDVLIAHQQGYENVVASMGTALTEAQVHLLKRLTRSLYLALDADTAGAMATLRGLEVIREVMDDRAVPVPTARGLVRFERELDGEVRIVLLPAGQDPDLVMRADPADWEKRVEEALPVLEYILNRIAQEADLTTAKGKAEAVRQALPLLSEVHDPVERGHYVQRLAHLVQAEERAILAQLQSKAPSRRRGGPAPLTEAPVSIQEGEVVERYLVALLYQHPWLRESLPAGASTLLGQEAHRTLLERLVEEGEGAGTELPGQLAVYLEGLFKQFQGDLQLEDALVAEALAQCLDRLEVLSIERQYRQYKYMVIQAEEEGDRELVREMAQQLSALSQRRGTIPTPPPSRIYPDLRRYTEDADGGPR